jgi:hypothetical protein
MKLIRRRGEGNDLIQVQMSLENLLRKKEIAA